jgi:membrane protein DedA with SNARE-associated domain
LLQNKKGTFEMNMEFVITAVQQYGYIALFFLLWLGIVGLPLPDEVIVMSAGLLTALGILNPIPAFFVTYAGVISGLSIGYLLGKVLGSPALRYLERKKDMNKYIAKSNRLLGRFGSFALALSYFFPVIRHVVPYVVGMTRMSYKRYAAFSYTTGFIWTLLYFAVGRYFGNNIATISNFLATYKMVLIALFLLGILFLWSKNSNMAENDTIESKCR